MIKLKVGTHGEIVIPKKIRESLGIERGNTLMLEMKESSVELRPSDDNVLERMRARAKKYDADISKWKMGNELYEEVF